jgi:hypothetical protein
MNYRPASGPLNAEQMAKLRRDLDIVYQNCFVFNDMLTNIQPGQEQADDVTLLQVSAYVIVLSFDVCVCVCVDCVYW